MKKTYIIPTSSVIELEMTQHVLTNSVEVNGSTGSVKNGGSYSGNGSDIFGHGTDDEW